MEKSIQKQKALELYLAGNSFGEIAKQIGEAKSTVHRWIKEEEKNNGTSGTPSGTGFGTDREQNGTNNGTGLQKETHTGSTVPQNRNEYSLENKKLAHVEMRKAELQHELQMAELALREKQYDDHKEMEQNEHDVDDLQLKLELVLEEIADLKIQNQQLTKKISSGNANQARKNADEIIPIGTFRKFNTIIKDYFSFDEYPFELEQINKLLRKGEKLRLGIYRDATKNKIHPSKIDDLKYINELLSDMWIYRPYCATCTGHVVPLKTGVISWPNLYINL